VEGEPEGKDVGGREDRGRGRGRGRRSSRRSTHRRREARAPGNREGKGTLVAFFRFFFALPPKKKLYVYVQRQRSVLNS